MSSSVEGIYSPCLVVKLMLNRSIDSKIDLLDSPESITKKIRKAEAAPKVVEENGVIALVEHILLPAAALKGNKEFRVERRDADPLVYTDIQQLKDDYANDIVRMHPPSDYPFALVTRKN